MMTEDQKASFLSSRSSRVLLQLMAAMAVFIAAVAAVSVGRFDLVQKVYLTGELNVILNGATLLLFFMGIVQLIRCLLHYAFEEKQIAVFARGMEEEDRYLFHRLSPKSLISTRYFTVKKLYEKRVPVNHSAMSAIMVAEESLYPSFARFVHNVLILMGVFGTIIGLILALVGGSSVLRTAVPGEGMGVMLLGMNTALTTTATAITCFFFFTYFYHKMMDIQTYLFGKVERAVLTYIVPEFAFDSETVNYKTENLVRELRELVAQLKESSSRLLQEGSADEQSRSFNGMDANLTQIREKMDLYIARQNNHLEKTDNLILHVRDVKDVLREGFRLNNHVGAEDGGQKTVDGGQ